MITVINLLTLLLWVLAIWFMLVRIEGYSKKDVILKTAATATVVVIAILANFFRSSVYDGNGITGEKLFRWLIVIGLIFGMLGDLRLGQSHISADKKVSYMRQGILCFGIDHVCNIAAMWQIAYLVDKKYLFIPFGAAIAFALLTGFGGRKLGLHFGRYTVQVSAYVGLLALDTFTAWGIWRGMSVYIKAAMAAYEEAYAATGVYDPAMLPTLGNVIMPVVTVLAAGQLAFFVSDCTLAPMYFGRAGNKPHYVIVNHVSYYLAQQLMAFSLLAFSQSW